MKKLALAISVCLLPLPALAVSDDLSSVTALNSVTVSLKGDFYNPIKQDAVQDRTPVIAFEGLTEKGGKQIAEGYKNAFNKDVMKMYLSDKLAQLESKITTKQKENILKIQAKVTKAYPELIAFYTGIAKATGLTAEQMYLAAWAEEGLFAYDIQAESEHGLTLLKEATRTKGCTAIGWNNGVIGQTQDMAVKLAGYGAIWKSPSLIVHAATPLYMNMAMSKHVAAVTNTVDGFNLGYMEKGAPISGITLASLNKAQNVQDMVKAFDKMPVNSAYASSFADTQGGIVNVELMKGKNIVTDGAKNGYVVHTNHPISDVPAMVKRHANGNYKAFDTAVANSLWRYELAELRAKYSPLQNVDALKDLFTQKPILMSPRQGNDFVTVNAVIHDLKAGCTYGTTWLPTLQDYTKVCFD